MYLIKVNNFEINIKNELVLLYLIFKLNIYVPRFCYSSYLNIAGNCRMCLLEIEKGDKLIIGCGFPLYSGLNIKTNSVKVQKARESIIEFLLLNHPLDCPICDQASQCDLQDQSVMYGSSISRFYNKYKASLTNKSFGFFLKGVLTRCIQCTKCVRLNINIVNLLLKNSINIMKSSLGLIGNINRGNLSSITTYYENLKNWYNVINKLIKFVFNSMNLFIILNISYFVNTNIFNFFVSFFVTICPVGSLIFNQTSGVSRAWDLKYLIQIKPRFIHVSELKFKRLLY